MRDTYLKRECRQPETSIKIALIGGSLLARWKKSSPRWSSRNLEFTEIWERKRSRSHSLSLEKMTGYGVRRSSHSSSLKEEEIRTLQKKDQFMEWLDLTGQEMKSISHHMLSISHQALEEILKFRGHHQFNTLWERGASQDQSLQRRRSKLWILFKISSIKLQPSRLQLRRNTTKWHKHRSHLKTFQGSTKPLVRITWRNLRSLRKKKSWKISLMCWATISKGNLNS